MTDNGKNEEGIIRASKKKKNLILQKRSQQLMTEMRCGVMQSGRALLAQFALILGTKIIIIAICRCYKGGSHFMRIDNNVGGALFSRLKGVKFVKIAFGI